MLCAAARCAKSAATLARPRTHAWRTGVFSSHEVADFAFYFGSGAGVFFSPGGVFLALAGFGEDGFAGADGDVSAGFGCGTLAAQSAPNAGGAEADGHPFVFVFAFSGGEFNGYVCRACDRVVFQVRC